MTAIDWIFEYTKERHRLRRLSASSRGFLGALRRVVDASHVWIILVVTGLLVGIDAAFISVASDWLGDIKTGFCKSAGKGTQFYLSKQFCCWGHDDFTHCQEWTPWRKALHIDNLGGAYVMEYLFYTTYAVLFAVAAAMLTRHYSIYARQSGIPEIKTMLGGFVIDHFLDPWTLVSKSFGLCLAVASGLWLGKEGPLVHLACCCAQLTMGFFDDVNRNEARKREVLSAAAAAGISVAFGAPIGGVLFSLEQLSYYFPDRTMWRSFVCAMVAAVTLQALDPLHTGKIVLYQITYTSDKWHAFELVPFVLLGLAGGLFGGLFIKLNLMISKARRLDAYPLKSKPILEVAITAFVVAIINFPNIFMRAQLSELVYYLFAECATIGSNDIFGLCKATTVSSLSMVALLVIAAVLGTLLASVTFGLHIPAGIILPSLAIGALCGRALGVVVELLHRHHPSSIIFVTCEADVPCVTPGTYAIVGAAAALAGTTRMTASIVVIMFELTGALTYVLPIMVAVMLGKWTGDVFSPYSIYEEWIRLNEYPHLDNKDDLMTPVVSTAMAMTRLEDLIVIQADRAHSIRELQNMLLAVPYRGFPVVEQARSSPPSKRLLGYIGRTELAYALDVATGHERASSRSHVRTTEPVCYFKHCEGMNIESDAPGGSIDMRAWMDQTPITLKSGSPLQLAASMFQQLGLRYLLLTEKGTLKGLLTKKDVWRILQVDRSRPVELRSNIHQVFPNGGAPGLPAHEQEREGLLSQNG